MGGSWGHSLAGHWRELAWGSPALGATSAGDMKPAAPDTESARRRDARKRMVPGGRDQSQSTEVKGMEITARGRQGGDPRHETGDRMYNRANLRWLWCVWWVVCWIVSAIPISLVCRQLRKSCQNAKLSELFRGSLISRTSGLEVS
jgi:hypothetical protein